MRDFNFCVIDEVDFIFIDEVRIFLIIFGLVEKLSNRYYKVVKIVVVFERDIYYTVGKLVVI